jgi:ankyrin repeat protein
MKIRALLFVGLASSLAIGFLCGCAPKMLKGPFTAAKGGTPQEMRAALDLQSVHPNDRDNELGKTLLMWAAQFNGNPEVAAVIIRAGGDLAARNVEPGGGTYASPSNGQLAYGWTALMWAADGSKNPEVITTLLNAGSDSRATDANGLTPLMIAAEYNDNAAVVARVAGAGSDVEAKDKHGYTALMYAASKTLNPAVVLSLLKAGASAKAKNDAGYSVLDYAKANPYLKDTDAMRQLQEASQ